MKIDSKAISELLKIDNPALYGELCNKSEPLLTNLSLIPRIMDKIKETYPEQSEDDRMVMFTSCVYHAFAPLTMIKNGISRAPNGMREKMCEATGWNNKTMCNYWQPIAQVYFKKRDREPALGILEKFNGYSEKYLRSLQGRLEL